MAVPRRAGHVQLRFLHPIFIHQSFRGGARARLEPKGGVRHEGAG